MIEMLTNPQNPVQRLHRDRGVRHHRHPGLADAQQQRPGGPAEVGWPTAARSCAAASREAMSQKGGGASLRHADEDVQERRRPPAAVQAAGGSRCRRQAGPGRLPGPQAGLDLLLLPLPDAVRVRGGGGVLPLRGQRLRPAADAEDRRLLLRPGGGYGRAQPLHLQHRPEAPRVDCRGLPRRPGPDADLRRKRHVDRGGDRQGRRRGRRAPRWSWPRSWAC